MKTPSIRKQTSHIQTQGTQPEEKKEIMKEQTKCHISKPDLLPFKQAQAKIEQTCCSLAETWLCASSVVREACKA